MLDVNTMGVVTCYAIIIAMAVIVFKALQYPLTGIINAFNPFLRNRQVSNLMERINDLEMNRFMYEDDIKSLKKEIKDLEKKVSELKRKK